ncbi:unnamed protein product [Rhizoctonia solani]|uniref:Fungal zn(2)-cys(6) binuclear cluster domain protein n=1 Tax=Rhizoctonia solani TaxID=456999 RepID=A0A8H2WC09_9AGAM|nr:unnamed protein product [Rhizoctonia solani]
MTNSHVPTSHDTVHAREDFDRVWLKNQNHLARDRCTPPHRVPGANGSLETAFVGQTARNHMARFLESLCASIPPWVVSTYTVGETRFIYLINEYQLQRVNCWFMPPPPQVRGAMVDQLKSSKMMICTVYLTFIGFATVSVALGYGLLRKALPGFLRLVAADSNLIIEHPNGSLYVSFPRTLGIPQQELNTFILYDAATAFALGVPSLVEYGYDGECDPTSHGYQCVHGVPVPLVEIISQVNSWRTGSRASLYDWRTLEGRAMAWQAQPLPIEDEDMKVNVARLAVQESWRYVTLVYLYMGMCDLSSHDPRVRASIARIVELEQSVTDISISMHMLMHYVVLGLAARHEQQRSVIRERLLSFQGRRVWLFRGPEFSRVLDHLWSGVGAGGASVTWNDYVQSRCAVLPI